MKADRHGAWEFRDVSHDVLKTGISRGEITISGGIEPPFLFILFRGALWWVTKETRDKFLTALLWSEQEAEWRVRK